MEVSFDVDEIKRLGQVKGKMKWKDISQVGYIFNLVKGMNIQEEEIGNKCASHLRNIALKRKTSVKELLKACPSLRQKKKKKSTEKKYVKNYFRGRGGGKDIGDTNPKKISNTDRIIEAISAQNRASAQQAAQFQIGQTQRLLTLENQSPAPLIIKDKPTQPAIEHAPLPAGILPAKMPQEQYTPDLRKELGLENWGHDFEAGTAERKAELKALDGKRNARVESYVRGIGEQYDMRTYNRTFPPPIAYDDNGDEIFWPKYKVPPNLDLSRIKSGQTGTTEGSELKEEPYEYEPPTITEEETIGGSGKLKHAREKGYYVGEGSVATSAEGSKEGLMTRSEIISEYGESEARDKGLISSRSSSSQPINPFLQSGSESTDLASLTSSQRELYLSNKAKLEKLEPMLEKMRVMKDIQEKEFKQNMAQTEMLRGALTQQYIGTLDAGGLTDNEKKANIRSLKDEKFKRDVLDHYGFESQTESSSASSSSSSFLQQKELIKDLKDATPSEAADYLLQREEVFAPKTKEEMLESLSGQSFQYKANQTKKDINDAIGEEKARLDAIKQLKALSAPSRNQSTRESLSSAGSFKPASGARQEAIRTMAQQQEGEVHHMIHPSGVSQQSYFHSLEGIREKMKAKAEASKAKNEFRDEELSRLKGEIGTFGETRKPTEEYLKTHSAAEVFQQKKIDDAEDALIKQRQKLSKDIKGGASEKAFYDFALNQPPKLGDTIAEEGKPSLHFLQNHSMYQYLEQQKKDKAAVAAQDERVLPEGAQFNPDGTINYIPSPYSYGGYTADEE